MLDRTTKPFAPAPECADSPNWELRLAFFKLNGTWRQELGPRPGEPGCRAPTELLLEQGFAPVVAVEVEAPTTVPDVVAEPDHHADDHDKAESEPAITARRPSLPITPIIRDQWVRQCVCDAKLRLSEIRIAFFLLIYLNNPSGESFPGNPTIMKALGMSESTVKRGLRRLEKRGHLIQIHRQGQGRGDYSRYAICLHEAERGSLGGGGRCQKGVIQ